MTLGVPPPRDLALLGVAVVLMLGGAVTLVGGWLAAAVAIPVITLGIELVVIERVDVHRQHAKHSVSRADALESERSADSHTDRRARLALAEGPTDGATVGSALGSPA